MCLSKDRKKYTEQILKCMSDITTWQYRYTWQLGADIEKEVKDQCLNIWYFFLLNFTSAEFFFKTFLRYFSISVNWNENCCWKPIGYITHNTPCYIVSGKLTSKKKIKTSNMCYTLILISYADCNKAVSWKFKLIYSHNLTSVFKKIYS